MIRINLLKPEAKEIPLEKARKEIKPPKKSLIYLLFVIAALALFFYQRNTINTQRNRLEAAQVEKNKFKDVLAKLEKVEAQKSLFEKKISLIKQLKPQQEVAVKIMDELSKYIPYWVWLTEVTYDKKVVNIKGKAVSNDLIADYIYSLETSPYFFNVNLISSTQRTIRNGQYLEFALNARCVLQPATGSASEENTREVEK